MALCRVECRARLKGGGRCTFAATMVRNPTRACPKCGAPVQPVWDPPSLETGNRRARRALQAQVRKAASRRSVDTPVLTADNPVSE